MPWSHGKQFSKGFKGKYCSKEQISIKQQAVQEWRPEEWIQYDNNNSTVKYSKVQYSTVQYSALHSIIVDIVLVHTHEHHVDSDTESDEQLHEGVEHNDG